MKLAAELDDLNHTKKLNEGNPLAETNTLRVVILTAVMMVVEIASGWYYTFSHWEFSSA